MNSIKTTRRTVLKTLGMTAASLSVGHSIKAAAGQKPNVLFIAVDDLRPQLGCYGHEQMISPNIDRLAGEGILFTHPYCQVPVCGASRASLLTGIRPTRNRFLNYNTWAEKDAPDSLSLPKHFKNNGYYTLSNGKIYHHKDDQRDGWSEEPWRPSPREGGTWRDYLNPENQKIENENPEGRGPAYEIYDGGDFDYFDGRILKKCVSDLKRLKEKDQPFFLAAGFLKPHLPFNAPKRFWDLYDRNQINMADNPFRPKDAPDNAMHNWGELRNYHGIPPTGPLDDDFARTLVHGYYACVSYTDFLIGELLNELNRLGLRENTIVILWGDHGWNLREHGMWCKHCNFEPSLHSPLIVSAPGFRYNIQSSGLVEYVDIYPSLCELTGLPKPDHLQGSSFVPLMKEPNREWKRAVISRWQKGDSVRTQRYRYTEWTDDKGNVTARMLYDHKRDPMENINVAEQIEHRDRVQSMSDLLKNGWKSLCPK